jgi:acyl carrier protein
MERKDIRDQLKSLILNSLRMEDLTPADLPDDQPLLDGDLEIDSVDILQLVLDIERHFGIKLVTAEFQREAWKTLDTLAATIEQRLQEAASGTK